MILIVMFARHIDYERTSFTVNSSLLLAIHDGTTLITPKLISMDAETESQVQFEMCRIDTKN